MTRSLATHRQAGADRHGFTLIEIMVVIILLAMIMGPLWRIFSAGTQSSMRGILQVETVREGRQILRQVHDDLKSACLEFTGEGMDLDFNNVLKRSGGAPLGTFKLFSFPSHGEVLNGSVPQTTTGKAFRRASEVTYTIETGQGTQHPLLRLIRKERFNPDHPLASQFPSGEYSKVMSERVNYFSIDPCTERVGGRTLNYYWVTLQLVDSTRPDMLAGTEAGTRLDAPPAKALIADFFDVAYPEYFCGMDNRRGFNPNWHTGIVGPGGAAP